MSSPEAPTTEAANLSHQDAFPQDSNLSNYPGSYLQLEAEEEGEQEDEDEDVDFNPFLRASPSIEASSSLSSEIEILDAGVVDSKGKLDSNLLPPAKGQDYSVGDSEHGEEIVTTQTALLHAEEGEKESEKASATRFKKRKSVLISESEIRTSHKMDNCLSSGTDNVNVVTVGNISHSVKPIMDVDDEDAICKRTRAHYSLAGFTLDELETFLQETDDDDDLRNVDDEEEYRKFLAAVLQDGDADNPAGQGIENIDDEDEENDADFEIEIEEALESDLDENTKVDSQQELAAAGRRPETRQNRRQKASAGHKSRFLGQANRPLRPLLPNAPIASYPVFIPELVPPCPSSAGQSYMLNGFTPHQLGQLHCLIHEHVQLLIQVFSLCVLEPSRQHIASEVRELISEIVCKRDQVLSWRRIPYPYFCFSPPYVHPSVGRGPQKCLTAPSISESTGPLDKHKDCSAGTDRGLHSDEISPSKEKSGNSSNEDGGLCQASENALWMPFVNGPIMSVMDVAPLKLVAKYVDDVSTAVREYQIQQVKATSDNQVKKEPLFPFHVSHSFPEDNAEILRENATSNVKAAVCYSGDQPPKKTLAAALVERTKRQSIALVPKEIAQLAQRFLTLFNPALFPHKPPPAPVANRVLFTDSEDELLALGLMEYNTDWKAIQQRFLPCKTKHQIFVRQKNRSSSKAPENPIKAVRRLKSSPLTAEEIARIEEGLKVFKLDWMSIWKFVVPYRDPSLIPRQWRIATGTQKSYKSTADKKEKRRLYESNRRKSKPAALASWQTLSDKEDCSIDNVGGENNYRDDCMDHEDEAYVHEAFLSDWRPGNTFSVSTGLSIPNLNEQNQITALLPYGNSHCLDQTNNGGSGESQLQLSIDFPSAIKYSHNQDVLSHFNHNQHNVSDVTLRPSKSHFCSWPYRSHRTNNARMVKLAPDLPPVNLPPSVRIMSESAFKSYQGGASAKVPNADASVTGAVTEKRISTVPQVSGSSHSLKSIENIRDSLEDGNCSDIKGKSDLQMHPLLFQSPGDGCLPYHALNCASRTSSSLNFLSQFQSQLNLSLLYNPQRANQTSNLYDRSSKSKEMDSSAGGIDFHPLLQKANAVNCDLASSDSVCQQSVDLEALKGSSVRFQNQSDALQSESPVKSSRMATYVKSSSSCEKANELDLDIHLSFTARREKDKKCRDGNEHNQLASNFSALGSATKMENQAIMSSSYPRRDYPLSTSALIRSNDTLGSGAHVLVTSSISGTYNEGDQSLPDIVMEQEELSDSEEEIGENVEFEREEMDDSEGDELSDSEQLMGLHNKVQSAAREKNLEGSVSGCEQQRTRTLDNWQGNISETSECGTSKCSMTAQGKEKPSRSTVNSCGPNNNKMKAKTVYGREKEASFGKSCLTASRGNRCKKTISTHSKEVVARTDDDACLASKKNVCKGNLGIVVGSRTRKRDLDVVNTGVSTIQNSSSVSNNDFG